MLAIRVLARKLRDRVVRSIANSMFVGIFSEGRMFYDDYDVEKYFDQDFKDCMSGYKKVIKRPELGYEMYKSSNRNVYVYYPPTGERRIFPAM